MAEQQNIIDELIDYIDKAILKNSVSNRHVAAVLAFLNEKLKDFAAGEIFLRRNQPDSTLFLLQLLGGLEVEKGLKTDTLTVLSELQAACASFSGDASFSGNSSFSGDLSSKEYVGKVLGWLISAMGDAEFNSVRIRGFLESDEYRYNRVEIISGEQWSSPGGGIIEDVDPLERTIRLKLEPGETAEVEIDDICKGKFNDSVTGFYTSYFRITEKIDDSTYKYVLRTGTLHPPQKMMHFVAYGNFTNKERQASSYSTQSYKRYLSGVNNWEITNEMIAMQLGDLSNLKLFGIDMTGHSAYLRNVYITGTFKQISDDGVTESRVPCFKGEWIPGSYYYYDEVTHNGASWLCISDKPTTQEPAEDATDWLEKSAAGKDAVVINIISSNGNIFQNGSVSTTLTALVTKGDRDITDSVPASRFSWEKESNNTDTDKIFNETHVGHGHVLELTPDDVWGRAVFNCIVNL